MKKIFAIFLITINFFASSDLIQISHIPHILNEFREHQNENISLSFFDFLQFHHEKCRINNTNHLNLHHFATSHRVVNYTLNQIKMLPHQGLNLKGNQSLEPIKYFKHYFSFIPPFHADGVFRPPISIA
jgi:hypothetical protein